MSLKKVLALIFALFLSAGVATVAYAATSQANVATTNYCVTFGHGASAAGNNVLFNWDNSACPAGTYNHEIQSSATTGTDNDPYLPQDAFTFFAGSLSNTAFPPTVFTIVDDTNAPGTVVTYHCHFTTPQPVAGGFVPGILCTN